MKKRYFIVISIVAVCLLTVFFLTRGEIELVQESNATEIPLEGVSLTISATRRELDLTISSDVVDYIIYNGYDESINLEMMQDGKWYRVRQKHSIFDPPAPISPDNNMTTHIHWKDGYGANLKKGQYRLVYTFWAMVREDEADIRRQTDNYVIIQEFTID